MISLAEQVKTWRSRHQLSRHEAAKALGVTLGILDDLERGGNPLRGAAKDAIIEKLARSPNPGLRGPTPDAGYRPGEH